MELTKDELGMIVYDPNRVQQRILEQVELATEGDYAVVNPTNPFTMLLEATATVTANGISESKSVIRKKYPFLAEKADEIYQHISDDELANMFAVPSEAVIVFHINVLDMKTSGYRPPNSNFVETTLPTGTEVTILDTVFTLLNDIVIRLYDNGSVFVEQLQNTNDISISDLGILNSGIVSDANSVAWVIFETRVKQVKKHVKNTTVTRSKGFKETISIKNEYFYSDVSFKNSSTNNVYTKIKKSHSEEYINPTTPTAYIALNGKDITFQIPDVYIIDGNIDGNVMLELYETKGLLYLPINKYKVEDFTIKLGDTGKSESASTSANLNILANSRMVVEGGSNGMTLDELKKSVVYNTTGNIDLPITRYQIERSGEHMGYEIFKSVDVITERLYVATKNLPKISSNLVLASHDIFFNTTEIILEEDINNSNIFEKDNYFIIKSNTIFKEINSVVKIVTDDELTYIDNLNNSQRIDYLKENKMFFTPYFYVIDTRDGFTSSRVYDLDKPVLQDLKILGKNVNINQRANIDKYTIIRTKTGYRVVLTLITNDEFKELDPTLINMQMVVHLLGGNVDAFIDGVYDPTTGYFSFEIETDLLLSEEGFLDLKNGYSTLFNKYINLETEPTFYIYTTDRSVVDTSGYLLDEIVIPSGDETKYIVLSKEKIKLTLGREIKYIWNKLYNSYTERKYKTYNYDLPLVHEEDVYDVNPETGSIYWCDAQNNITTNKLYSKGDPVLDEENNPVYKFRKGDIVLDNNNTPIVDTYSGIVRYIDICMLEYEFKLAQSIPYKNYTESVKDIIDSYLYKDMAVLNEKTLENTTIMYKSYKSAKPVILNINNIYYAANYKVKPNVTLYINSTSSLSSAEIENYKDKVGSLIDKELSKSTVKLSEVKENIMTALGSSIVAVKIENLDGSGKSEVIKLQDKTTRLVMNKKLDSNKNNELIVRYDLDLAVQYV